MNDDIDNGPFSYSKTFHISRYQIYTTILIAPTSTTNIAHTANNFTNQDIGSYVYIIKLILSHITSAVHCASSIRYRMNEIIYTLHTHNNCSLINIPDNKLCVLLLSWQQILLIILCILVNYQLMRQLCNNIDVFLIV